MPKFSALKPKDMVKILTHVGFVFLRQKGSHRIYIKGNVSLTIPYHNKELRIGTQRAIIKQSGLDPDIFK